MLRISLRDGEKVVVNGAVLRAVGRTEFLIENKASVMRGREVMPPEQATTPARQLYFHTMMAYVDPAGSEQHQDRLLAALKEVMALLVSPEAVAICTSFATHAANLEFYKGLADCRQLMRLEAELLGEINSAA
jgi:flagellar protein FlbT